MLLSPPLAATADTFGPYTYTTNNGQATDTAQLTSLGCDPTRKDTVAVKSNHHFRAAFQTRAALIVDTDAPGPACLDLSKLPYRKVPQDLRRTSSSPA